MKMSESVSADEQKLRKRERRLGQMLTASKMELLSEIWWNTHVKVNSTSKVLAETRHKRSKRMAFFWSFAGTIQNNR